MSELVPKPESSAPYPVVVQESADHIWVRCDCASHLGGEYEGEVHGGPSHCCDQPHDQPPGLTRYGRSPYDGPYLQTVQLCKDGVGRTDCVVVVDTKGGMGEETMCGKPMVGTVPMGTIGRFRMCRECFDLFTHKDVS